jgi:hypothetical protein
MSRRERKSPRNSFQSSARIRASTIVFRGRRLLHEGTIHFFRQPSKLAVSIRSRRIMSSPRLAVFYEQRPRLCRPQERCPHQVNRKFGSASRPVPSSLSGGLRPVFRHGAGSGQQRLANCDESRSPTLLLHHVLPISCCFRSAPPASSSPGRSPSSFAERVGALARAGNGKEPRTDAAPIATRHDCAWSTHQASDRYRDRCLDSLCVLPLRQLHLGAKLNCTNVR